MNPQEQYDLITSAMSPHRIGNRNESITLLSWFMENVWRADPETISDSICDGGGDKGIDAIILDEATSEICVFQGKHRRTPNRTQGDSDLKNFVGCQTYFRGPDGIDDLLNSGPNTELKDLVARLELRNKLEQSAYSTRFVFVTNGVADSSALDYVRTLEGHGSAPPFELWHRERIAGVAESTQRPGLRSGTIKLKASVPPMQVDLGSATKMAIALISAKELVQIPGIDDLTVFGHNVRLALGTRRTRINRELGLTIEDPNEHQLFPAYHNGMTILTDDLTVNGCILELRNVAVVNGCQSLTALRRLASSLTDDLRVLVKVIDLGNEPKLVDDITYRSNNQNPVNIRDQRGTHSIQRQLQLDVTTNYPGVMFYKVRQGETAPGSEEVLDNRLAAQLITAIWRGLPWAAVRKLALFDADYLDIFDRRIDAHKLRLAFVIDKCVADARSKLDKQLQSSFASIRFTIVYLVAKVIVMPELGDLGAQLMDQPERWFPTKEDEVQTIIERLTNEVADSVNFHVKTEQKSAADDGRPYDHKVVFKSQTGVARMERDVLRDARRDAGRYDDYRFDVAPN